MGGIGAGEIGDALSALERCQSGRGVRVSGVDGRGGRGSSRGIAVILHFFFTIGR